MYSLDVSTPCRFEIDETSSTAIVKVSSNDLRRELELGLVINIPGLSELNS